MKISRFISGPSGLDPIRKKNFINVQIDAIGVGLASAASPFLPVFLTRLGASSFEVGLLTSMPALTGLLFAIPMGQFLQNQRKIVPWFSTARLLVILSYALTGLISFFVAQNAQITGILLVWALATIPQTMLAITFSVVMNAVAGPDHRFELMTRRWSILGFTTAVTVFCIGQVLDRIVFPLNYQLMFLILSVGGLVSYYFSSKITLGDIQAHKEKKRQTIIEQFREYIQLVSKEKPFQSFVIKRFVYLSGQTLTIPLFPLYFVREINASDSWIAAISTTQTAVVILGYFIWTRQSRSRGSRNVLLWSTLGAALFPIMTALTHQSWLITIFAGINGIFQAGINLVFFDELMKTVPPEYSSTFVSLAQGLQYLSTIASPIIGTFLGDNIGLGPALVIGGFLQLIGFMMFWLGKPVAARPIPEGSN